LLVYLAEALYRDVSGDNAVELLVSLRVYKGLRLTDILLEAGFMRDPLGTDARFLKASRDLEQAVSLQRQGHVAEAEKMYSRVIKKNPEYFDALHFYGLFRPQRGWEIHSKRLSREGRNPRHKFSKFVVRSYAVVLSTRRVKCH
jgi:hypothetical protein